MSVPLYALTDTWNSGSTVFTAILMNVTNTASASGSKLMDLQVGGTSQIAIGDGATGTFQSLTLGSQYMNLANSGGWLQISGQNGVWMGVNNSQNFATWASGVAIASALPLMWSSSGGALPGTFDVSLNREAAGVLAQRNGTSANSFRVYNTYTDASNYERGVFDWTTTSNTLTIGSQAAGTGSGRNVRIVAPGTSQFAVNLNSSDVILSNAASGQHIFYFWPICSNGTDTGLFRTAAGVWELNNGSIGNLTGTYLNWGGQKRVTSDFSVTSSAVLTDVTGLSVSVAAGRTYTFEAKLFVTDAAAGGVQASINGTATATAIQYTGWTVADNAIKGKANATAMNTAVGNTTTTETAGIVVMIQGTITVNAAGTLTVRMAQSVSNATATVAKRGSYFIVQDMP